jgi:Glycosyltransferase family 87
MPPASPTHMAASSRWMWPLTLLCLLVWWFVAPTYLEVGRNAVAHPPSSDFHKFYLSAQRVEQGHSMYWLVPPRTRIGDPCHPDTQDRRFPHPGSDARLDLGGQMPCLGPNLNPPAFMAILLPLAALPYDTALWTWAMASWACGVLSIGLMVKTWVRQRSQRWCWTLAGCTALFSAYPSLGNHELGQLGNMLLLCLTLAWLNGRRGHDVRAGCWLGLAIGIKPFLLVVPLAYVMGRRWRLLIAMAMTIIGSLLLGLLLFGVESYQDYWLVARNVHWTGSNWNASWTGWFDRAFMSQPDASWPATRTLSHTLAAVCGLATLGVYVWAARGHRPLSDDHLDDTVAALGPAVSLLVSPLGWSYYFPMLALGAFLAVQRLNQIGWTRAHGLALFGLWLMFSIPVSLKGSPGPRSPADWLGLDSWFNLALWCATAGLVWAQRKRGA